jgi:hypothetical protein
MLRERLNSRISVDIIPGNSFDPSSAGELNYGFNAIINPVQSFGSVTLPLAISGCMVSGFIIAVQTEYLSIWSKVGSSDTINEGGDFTYPPNLYINDNQIFTAICITDGNWIITCSQID